MITQKRALACIVGYLLLAASLAYPAETTAGPTPQAPPSQWVEYAQAIEAAGNSQDACQAKNCLAMLLMDQLLPCHWVGAWAQGPYVLQFAKEDATNGILSPLGFDAVIPASQLDYRKFRTHVVTEGPGVPAVAVFLSTPERMARYPLLNEKGMALAVTVGVELSPATKQGRREVLVKLIDSAKSSTPVAADYTAPYSWLTEGVSASKIALAGMLRPEESLGKAGLFATQPYDPRRIPLVFVHGLDSSPMTWLDLANELGQDTAIRQRYQIWVFRYPSGLPIMASSGILRRELDDAQRFCDPKGKNSAFNQMILVGHSMGGILTRLMVSDSGNVLYNTYFDQPLDKLQLPADEKAKLKEIAFFKHRPYIKRAVFISTPHRGSRFATNAIGKLGRRLVTAPGRMMEFTQNIAEASPDAFSSIKGFDPGKITSIDSLRPDNPTLKALECIPIMVPFHSIMGDRGYGALGNEGDGVVRYWSSHLDGAQSELIVPSDHGAQQDPMAIQEIDRILREHLQSAAMAPKQKTASGR
jgi:pimeloyl-ACP methyl ester carboxylesterase